MDRITRRDYLQTGAKILGVAGVAAAAGPALAGPDRQPPTAKAAPAPAQADRRQLRHRRSLRRAL
jgi:hypothetical protein